MKFNVNQQDLQKSLNYCQGVIEKRSTLPILSNVMLDANNKSLTITATDLDLVFIHNIDNVEILDQGKTTTSSATLYDIVRKFSSGNKINFALNDDNKLQLESEKSVFHLNCIDTKEFPLTDENFNQNEFVINSKDFLKLLNKCKFSISNDETRHYLSGIFFHISETDQGSYLTAAATDSHRMSISKIKLVQKIDFNPIILPKKTVFQLCSILEDYEGELKISNLKSLILKTLDTNKALDVISIDLKNKSSIADYMIIASGTSSRHIQALSEQVVEEIKMSGIKNCKIEGNESNDWKLIDGIDIIIHIFNPEKRKFYELEKMWSELIPKEKLII